MKKVIFLIQVLISIFSCSVDAKNITNADIDKITGQSTNKTCQFKVWDSKETFTFNNIFPCSEPCNSPGFSAMVARYKKPIRWIQVIRFNKPGYDSIKENLPHRLLKYSYDEWVYLDGTNQSEPYLYDEETDRVYDNPRATYPGKWGKDEPLTWEAFLFGVELNKEANTIKPILGVYWGYRLPQKGTPTPLQPKELSRNDFKKIFKQYDIDLFISDITNGLKVTY